MTCGHIVVQGKGQLRPNVSLNTASPRTPNQPQESKLNRSTHFICCYDCVQFDVSECGQDLPLLGGALFESRGMRWGKSKCGHWNCMCVEGHNVRQNLNLCFLQQSMYGIKCLATDRQVRSLAHHHLPCLGLVISARALFTDPPPNTTLTRNGMLQEACTRRAGGPPSTPSGHPDAERTRTPSGTGKPPNPHSKTPRTPTFIVLQDGVSVPKGYKYVESDRAEPEAANTPQMRNGGETMEFKTPPNATEPSAGEGPDPANRISRAKRNLTRNINRKANTTFAKEMKDSLAEGRRTTVNVKSETTDLKGAWHAAAKEVAYKILDLRKESWKDYSIFEKSVVHKELKAAYNFDPPLDPQRIDKYLSCHLRTSRAVWKAHWKKHGSGNRHHNCPEEAWEKLTQWWPTAACQEEAAIMASRRSRVEKTSNVGRSSLVDRMDVEVSRYLVVYACECGCPSCFVCCLCVRGLHVFRSAGRGTGFQKHEPSHTGKGGRGRYGTLNPVHIF